YDAFESDDFSLNAAGAVKRLNISHESMDVYVIGNFDITAKEVVHSFSEMGYWYNYFTGDSIYVTDPSALQDTLQPGEFSIYTTVKLPSPEPGVEESDETIVTEYNLAQNYPNPFNPVTNIQYSVKELENVTLKIYDILGREVTILLNEVQQPGRYNIRFDGSSLSSGIYFYKLQAGKFAETRKMILMK
ncbi:MAG: T9SS type A sorting domain-containing protein, partial [Ignavibacteriaceae bacterium]